MKRKEKKREYVDVQMIQVIYYSIIHSSLSSSCHTAYRRIKEKKVIAMNHIFEDLPLPEEYREDIVFQFQYLEIGLSGIYPALLLIDTGRCQQCKSELRAIH